MKNFLLALMVVLTTCTLAIAQNQTTVVRDSVGKVKITVTKDNKAKTNNTAVTVIGVDTADIDSTEVDTNSSNVNAGHGKASFTFESDDDDFPFHGFGINGGTLVAIISVIAVFGFPVFILFVIFFFRYINRKARYRLAEQALAAGQPLPVEFIRENKTVDSRSQGIKNTFTGIGLFIFLWAITGEFGIGTIGLLVTFMGIGQWIIGSKQQAQDTNAPQMHTSHKDEKKNQDNVKNDSFEMIPFAPEEKDNGVNEEKNDENK
ncbi:DUF6249 domain-containing protein [Bacteroides caecimuris]|jgi:hypothetical protein|uniref:DUF6249 domain-containing protein n=1 Tax=Bacteroides caecimuris TaxID=1796613 RepID=A0A1C7H1J4_9BACE|nr:DUF6249 domain-containing protein [Bacteroides caecimuris]ANU58434.1 hypothetical protein A4V03_13345 [Bacteroides caecimuris]OXE65682.1 hypothetical protein ADH74_07570 [Bacteroides caecimuris]QQR16669.1 hypothetical protein I5Q79_15820 [Bacteroides caecimuris]UQA29652.1 DUF6249 domain-containing protein [Bacteroides caecimuris]